jgi:hypothetical protein
MGDSTRPRRVRQSDDEAYRKGFIVCIFMYYLLKSQQETCV